MSDQPPPQGTAPSTGPTPLGRRDLLAVLLLFAAIGFFFWKLLFTNLILGRGDTLLYIYPYWTAAAAALRAGRLPLWNPILFMGAPFLANSQAGLLYPPNWPLWLAVDVPTAASLSILLHLCLAAGFGYGFARAGLRLRRPAAWLAAALYPLGGYLSAQIEHINQLQGLAWLPAVMWLLAAQKVRARAYLLAAVLGLQLLAGHTQAAFITVVGAAIYAGWLSVSALRRTDRRLPIARLPITQLAIAGLAALLISAAQVLPTLELSRQSVRGGSGLSLSEAVSFSLHPLLAGRALLPGYGETVFSEYTAFLPLGALLLAFLGLWAGRRRPAVVALSLVAAVGLFFSLGAANPVYVLLVKGVPGFALFRAPARWLALYAFSMAGLAGVGLDAALARRALPSWRTLVAWGLGVLLLIGWALLAPLLAPHLSSPPESPIRPPSAITCVAWSVELLLVILAFARFRTRRALLPTCLLAVFFASRALPYNHPTAPEAYGALRPAAAHLQAAALACPVGDRGCSPPGRFLSMSNILFDPGDSGELESIYADQLGAEPFYDLIVAAKQKEILAPNLPLTFGVPAVDGYDGGVLPLAHYASLTRLLLPAGVASMDGRLRENLDTIPDGRWLRLFNVRYLITDKVGDAWADDVYYDLQLGATLDRANAAVEVATLPSFEATGLGIVSHLQGGPHLEEGAPVGKAAVRFSDGSVETLILRAGIDTAEGRYNAANVAHPQPAILRVNEDGAALYVTRLAWHRPGRPTAVTITLAPSVDTVLHVHGLSLLDERDGAFQSLVLSDLGRFRLVHSGDVKIYENLDVLPRAFLVHRASWVTSDQAALERMGDAAFDPAGEVVLLGNPNKSSGEAEPPPGRVTFEVYRPERIELRVEAANDAWLVLSDAYYPGWQATVDGEPVKIERADVLFRAVPIRPGSQRVVLTFRPGTVRVGVLVSGISLLCWLVGWLRARSDD